MAGLQVVRPRPDFASLGAALWRVSGAPPFSTYPAGELVRTLERQIRTGTAVMAREDGRTVGYFGWEPRDRAASAAFARDHGLLAPDGELEMPAEGAFVWVTVVAADGAAVLRALTREARRLTPDTTFMAVRRQRGRTRLVRPVRNMTFGP